MNSTGSESINFIPNTGENTWRNITFAIVIFLGLSIGGTYYISQKLYTAVQLSGKETNFPVLAENNTEINGVTEYKDYIVGGDITFDKPISTVPEKNTMFVPFNENSISASIALLKDIHTGEVLFGKGEYESHPIASITKLMSALVLEDRVKNWSATGTIPSDRISDSHVDPGETATLDEWYTIALVGSSNRAVLALVDATEIDRSEFIGLMNEKARELGMTSSVFTDPTGIDEGNVSTASDIAILLSEALAHKRITDALQVSSYTHLSSRTNKIHEVWSTNWLMTNWIPHDFKGVIFGKTGYIEQSGYNFAGKFTRDDGRTVIAIALGSSSAETRFTDALKLADWAFINYHWK